MNKSEVTKKAYAIGFIKTRKSWNKIDKYFERMEERAAADGLEMLFIDADVDGSRSIDRPQLDNLYDGIKLENVGNLFLRDVKDVTDDWEDIMEFVRFLEANDVVLHLVNVEPWGEEVSEKVWDGGIGC